jgi:hypothetical protein
MVRNGKADASWLRRNWPSILAITGPSAWGNRAGDRGGLSSLPIRGFPWAAGDRILRKVTGSRRQVAYWFFCVVQLRTVLVATPSTSNAPSSPQQIEVMLRDIASEVYTTPPCGTRLRGHRIPRQRRRPRRDRAAYLAMWLMRSITTTGSTCRRGRSGRYSPVLSIRQ